MQANEAIIQKSTQEVSPLRLVQREVEQMAQKNSAPIQYMLGSGNLSPEQLEMLYMIKLRELKTSSNVRNYAELYGNDVLSQLHMACYNAENFLSAVIKQATNFIRMPKTEIYLNCNGCSTVVLDARKTSLIIYNLISNSLIHAKSPEKIITLNASMRGNDFVISVTDNGKGIPASRRKHLFNAYADISAVENLTTDFFTLSGMGLAISRKAAREMNGDLVYAATKRGTTFEIVLPQDSKSVLNEPAEYIPDTDFVSMCLATANLFYIENCRS